MSTFWVLTNFPSHYSSRWSIPTTVPSHCRNSNTTAPCISTKRPTEKLSANTTQAGWRQTSSSSTSSTARPTCSLSSPGFLPGNTISLCAFLWVQNKSKAAPWHCSGPWARFLLFCFTFSWLLRGQNKKFRHLWRSSLTRRTRADKQFGRGSNTGQWLPRPSFAHALTSAVFA